MVMALAVAATAAGATTAMAGDSPAAGEGPAPFARHFVQEAVAGNAFEIRAGTLAGRQATSQAVRQLARQIVSDHQKAQAQIRAAAKELGITLPGRPTPVQVWLLQEVARTAGGGDS